MWMRLWCMCVFMPESSENDSPGYRHLQVLHSLENIGTTVTMSIEWRSSFPWQPRLKARSPWTARWKVVTFSPESSQASKQTIWLVLHWTQNPSRRWFQTTIHNHSQRESDVSPKISKSWNLHSIIFNQSTLEVEARTQPPTSFRLRDLPPWLPKMLSPQSLWGCYFLFQQIFGWQSKQPDHFQGRSSSPFDPWNQGCNQKKSRPYVRRLDEANRSIQSAPWLLAIPVQRANQSTSEDVFALAGSGLAGFGWGTACGTTYVVSFTQAF